MSRWPRSNGGSNTRELRKIQPGADRDTCSSRARQASHTRGSPWATRGHTICLLGHWSDDRADTPSCHERRGLPSALSNGRRRHWKLRTPLLQIRLRCSSAVWLLPQWCPRGGALSCSSLSTGATTGTAIVCCTAGRMGPATFHARNTPCLRSTPKQCALLSHQQHCATSTKGALSAGGLSTRRRVMSNVLPALPDWSRRSARPPPTNCVFIVTCVAPRGAALIIPRAARSTGQGRIFE